MLQPRDKIVENNRARKETEIEPIRKWKMPKEAVPVNAMGFHLELNKKEGGETLSKRGRDSVASFWDSAFFLSFLPEGDIEGLSPASVSKE